MTQFKDSDFVEKKGMINRYTCRNCGRQIVTVNQDAGVTPMFIDCRYDCDRALMSSAGYKTPQHISDGEFFIFDWYRPVIFDGLDPATVQHVQLGGLILRRRFHPVFDALRKTCDCGRWLFLPPEEFTEQRPFFCNCGRRYYTTRSDEEVVFHRIDIKDKE